MRPETQSHRCRARTIRFLQPHLEHGALHRKCFQFRFHALLQFPCSLLPFGCQLRGCRLVSRCERLSFLFHRGTAFRGGFHRFDIRPHFRQEAQDFIYRYAVFPLEFIDRRQPVSTSSRRPDRLRDGPGSREACWTLPKPQSRQASMSPAPAAVFHRCALTPQAAFCQAHLRVNRLRSVIERRIRHAGTLHQFRNVLQNAALILQMLIFPGFQMRRSISFRWKLHKSSSRSFSCSVLSISSISWSRLTCYRCRPVAPYSASTPAKASSMSSCASVDDSNCWSVAVDARC